MEKMTLQKRKFQINKDVITILVLDIGSRGDIYKKQRGCCKLKNEVKNSSLLAKFLNI